MTTTAIAPDQDVISTEVFIAAPPARVFQAVTDPTQMLRWWGHHDHFRVEECESDLRVGGRWSIRGVKGDGKAFHTHGEYLEVDPPHLLVQSWMCTSMGAVKTVLHWELEAQTVHGLYPSGPHRAGTGTLVRIRHEGFAGYPADAAGHYQGWQQVLGWLRDFVEKE